MKKQPYKIGDLLVCIIPKVGNPEFDLQIGKIYKGLSDVMPFGNVRLSGPGASDKIGYRLSRFYPASLIGKYISPGDLVMCVDAQSMAPEEMKVGDVLRVSETSDSSVSVEIAPGLYRNYRHDRFIKLYEAGKEGERDNVLEVLRELFPGATIVEEKAEAKKEGKDMREFIDGLAGAFAEFFGVSKDDLLNEVAKQEAEANADAKSKGAPMFVQQFGRGLRTPLGGKNTDRVDNVNNPAHYTAGGIECIEAIRAALTPEEFRGYCKGNSIKYIWRERMKGGDESIQKSEWYMREMQK